MPGYTPISKVGNKYYPLPADYDTLTREGQRLARVNACRMDGSPEEAIASWAWWCKYYLQPDSASGFEPNFYKAFKPFAPAHYHIIGWLNQFKCVAIAAPRGFAKSTLKRSWMLQRLVAYDQQDIASFLITDKHVSREVYRLRMQIERNPRIYDDFGDLRMARGEGIWNLHEFTLKNGNSFSATSIGSAIRGMRPDLAVLDDVELDEDNKSSAQSSVAEMKDKIQSVVLPMLEENSKMVVFGTMVGKNSFLYHVISSEEDANFRPVQKGGYWWKINIPAKDAKGNNAWSNKYTDTFLQEKLETMGRTAFMQEYMGEPGSDEDCPFSVLDERHEWTTPADPGALQTKPLLLADPVNYTEEARKDGQDIRTPRSAPLNEHFSQMTRVIAVDYAEGLSSAHDYSAIVVGALDSRNDLWILDAWYGRVWSPALAAKVWELAERWQVHQIGVESVSTQMEVVRLVRQWGEQRERSEGWSPSVVPLKYPMNLSKGDRIMGLEWRFNQGKIKLPVARRSLGWDATDAIPELYRQIRDFTPDLKNLRHDDVIDAMAMLQYMFRSRVASFNPVPAAKTIEERIASGEVFYPGTTIPLISAIDWRKLPQATLYDIMETALQAKYRQREMGMDELPPMLTSPQPLEL